MKQQRRQAPRDLELGRRPQFAAGSDHASQWQRPRHGHASLVYGRQQGAIVRLPDGKGMLSLPVTVNKLIA